MDAVKELRTGKCPICLDTFGSCLLTLTGCGHAFHEACLIPVRSATEPLCPYCRTELPRWESRSRSLSRSGRSLSSSASQTSFDSSASWSLSDLSRTESSSSGSDYDLSPFSDEEEVHGQSRIRSVPHVAGVDSLCNEEEAHGDGETTHPPPSPSRDDSDSDDLEASLPLRFITFSDDFDALTVTFQNKDTIATVQQRIADDLGYLPSELRLIDFHGRLRIKPLSNPNKTLLEEQIIRNQLVLVERIPQ